MTDRIYRSCDEAHREVERLREALKIFAKIEVPENATPGTWVARTLFCNDQVTAHSVWKARAALGDQGRD